MVFSHKFYLVAGVIVAALVGCSTVKTGFVIVDIPEIDEGVENALTRIEMHDSRKGANITFETEREKIVFTVQPNIPLSLGIRLGHLIEQSPRAFLRQFNKTDLKISVAIRATRGVTNETGATGVVIAADAAPVGGSVTRRQLYYGSGSFEATLPVETLDREQFRLALESALDALADEIFKGFVRDISPDLVPDGDAPLRRAPSSPGLTS